MGNKNLPRNFGLENQSSTIVISKDGVSNTHHINTIMSPLPAPNEKRPKNGKSPSPPLVPPRGVVRSSSSTSSRIWELQGISYGNKNRPLSQDSKDSSIPYADDSFKESLLSNSSRELEGMQDNARNMVVHNRSRENHSSLENVSIDSNGSGQKRPIATIIPHNCIGGCEPGTRGQMKTGWL